MNRKSEITAGDRKEIMAWRIATKPHWWQTRYMDALERVETPGELDELADASRASIEASAPGAVDVFVCANWGEESDTLTPDEARDLGFELLVLADLAEKAEPDQA